MGNCTRPLMLIKVAAVVLFSPLRDMEAFGRMGNTLAKELGSEKAVFVGSVLDADENTIGDDSLSLPHVLLVLPSGKRIPWSDWVPNMDPTWGHDRLRVAKELGAWIVEQLDACSDSGECHDVISEKKANKVRLNVQEDLRAQAGTRQPRSSTLRNPWVRRRRRRRRRTRPRTKSEAPHLPTISESIHSPSTTRFITQGCVYIHTQVQNGPISTSSD